LELERTQREQAWREIAQQVAHEIKNPLTPMKLTLQQLERLLGDDKQEKVERSLSSLLTQVDTLDGIASSFSTFAKMPEPVLSRVELVRLTENIVELHKDSGAQFSTNEKEAMVVADKQLIGRIFSNIILNGLQSTTERHPDMHVTLLKVVDHYRVVFSDKGEGIAQELREKIFLPHFTTKQTGSGLGLAIAKQGIEQMGGKIWFETEVGTGTSFYIELPFADETRN
jgi:nitrogen fixation/metabolism regulation signal transduction histidine kinase